ncbi:hypothetical protein [Flavobacterium psychrotrophum]|uniref:hypothetical protein n=1 Tax=Flavobacterium psychrotrophum TaxID=2294119 RepID=UPI000E31B06E|nr:hypothetical protein [Flavobacterium psychrotrophum]
MKIHQKALLVAAGFLALTASAQDKCKKAYELLKEKTTAQAYDEALVFLATLRKDCPKYDVGLYDAGDKLLTYKFETTRADADKAKIADDLVKLYNEQQNNFPGSGAAIKKALFLHRNAKATDAEVYKVLDAAFVSNSTLFTDYNALELYFNLSLKQYEAGTLSPDAFIKRYGDIVAQVAAAKQGIADKRSQLQKKQEDGAVLEVPENAYLAETKSSEDALDAVADNMAKQGSAIFSCSKLEAYYNESFEKKHDDVAWIRGMVNSLKAAKCAKSALLFNGIEILYKANPTYAATYDMGYYSQKKGDAKGAIKYYEEAAAKQPDVKKKAELYMEIAALYRSADKVKAKEFALMAASANVKFGRPYLFIAEMYRSVSSKECGLGDFEKKALVWAAIDMLKKAEEADAKLVATVTKLKEEYSKNIPTKKEAKVAKKSKGDVITYGCWINETVTLPKLK